MSTRRTRRREFGHSPKRKAASRSRVFGQRWLLSVVAMTIAGLLLTACGSSNGSSSASSDSRPKPAANVDPALKALVEAAQKEGSLEVWGVLNPEHLNAVAKAFEGTYGIKTTITAYAPSDIETRVDAEQASKVGSQDVLLQTDRTWHVQNQAYWAKITGPDALAADKLVRNGAAPVKSDNPTAKQVLYDDDTRLTTLYAPWGYAWRKDAFNGKPSFEDLFSGDTFKEAIGTNDPQGNPPMAAVYYYLHQRYPDLFERLGKLKPTLYPLSGPAAQALGAGAVDAVLAISASAVSGLNDVGFAYDDKFPALASPVYASILKSSKSPNAAQLFVDWLMTPAGQKAWCSGYASVLPDISTATLSSKDVQVYDANSLSTADLNSTVDDFNKALGR